MPKRTAYIFDFDGTIADSFVPMMQVFLSMKPRFAVISKGEIERMRGLTMLQVAKELRIRFWEVPFLVGKGRRLQVARMGDIKIIPGIEEVIRQLHATGHPLYVLSSNSPSNIKAFLERYHLLDQFTAIKGNVGLLGKRRPLKQLMAKHHLSAENTWYVGDEARDITSAHQAGVRIAAVTWGYNNPHILMSHQPDALVMRPEELLGLKQ